MKKTARQLACLYDFLALRVATAQRIQIQLGQALRLWVFIALSLEAISDQIRIALGV